VGYAGKRADFAIDEIAALDGDRIDAYQNFIRPADRVGDIFIAEDLGPPF